ncbi:MAG: DUF5074 domain-containing protein [Bacteroidota bacterium]
MRNFYGIFYLLLIGILAFSGCDSDDEVVPQAATLSSKGVFILHEGNFLSGNASIDFFSPADSSLEADLFKRANNQLLGDVLQSMTLHGAFAYLVVNNSGVIEVVDTASFTSSATITGLQSPRYMVPVSDSKAYVSDLFANQVHIVDLLTNQKTGSIPLPGWTEKMALHQNEVWVTNSRKPFVYVIDPATDQLADSVAIDSSANSLQVDNTGNLWVLCAGEAARNQNARLFQIDPAQRQVVQALTPSSTGFGAGELQLTAGGDKLCFLMNGVWEYDLAQSFFSNGPVIPENGKNFYGLGVDPVTDERYVADALDFVQRGRIEVYQADGTLVRDFLSGGIIPGEFVFR